MPILVAIASDGTIWSAGYEYSPNQKIDSDARTVRQFNRSGKLLKFLIPQSALEARALKYGYFAAGNDRLGWYTGPLGAPGSHYIEVFPDGTVTWFPGVPLGAHPERITGFGLGDNGVVFVTSYNQEGKKSKVFTLDRVKREWVPIDVPSLEGQRMPRIYGAEGLYAVFSGGDRFAFKFLEIRLANERGKQQR